MAKMDRHEFTWGDFWILPLHQRRMNGDRDEVRPLLGLLGVARKGDRPMDKDQRDAVWLLADRAALALGRSSTSAACVPLPGGFAAAD